MSNIYKGTTPTFVFTFADFDPTTASKVLCSFSNGLEITDEDMDITSESVSIWLSQEQTLAMPTSSVSVQFNFLFADGQRAASTVKTIWFDRNLHNEVMS